MFVKIIGPVPSSNAPTPLLLPVPKTFCTVVQKYLDVLKLSVIVSLPSGRKYCSLPTISVGA